MIRFWIGFIVAVLFTPLFGLEKVSIQLKWHHQFQFAGYYAALEKGFYREEGLDVTLKDRDISKNNIKQVLNSESEYGIADSVLLLYQAQRQPIVIISPIFQHSPNVLITLKSSGIDSPYKLIGKRIALYPNDADGLPILAMLHETGILQKGIERVNTNFDIDALTRKDIDAHHGYLTNEPYMLLQKGIETYTINPLHFGVDMYGDMLFTTQKELDRHPARVAAMKRATIRGWKYALAHKEEIIRLIQSQYAPEKTINQLRYEASGIESVISPSTIPIGTLDYGRLEYIQNLLRRHGLISTKISLKEYIYQDTQTGSLNLSQQERTWLALHPIIRLAVDPQRAPLEYIDKEGNFQGISADYMNLIGQKLGVQFKPYFQTSWSDTIHLMEQHQLDMLPCTTKTEQRETYAIFTPAYLNFHMVIVTDKRIRYLDGAHDLKGKIVAVTRNHFPDEILRQSHPDIRRLEVNTIAEGLEAVSAGKAYAFIDNSASITEAIKSEGYAHLKISGELPYRFELSIGVRKDWPIFAEIMEKALYSISSKERDAIYKRHITLEYTQQFSWERIIKIIVPIGFVILILLYYNRKVNLMNRALHTAVNNLYRTENELRAANRQLQMLSTTDSLTGLSNRYRLDEALKQAIENAKRYSRPFSIIMVDLDYFKIVNDTFGHHAGDKVLKQSAEILRQNCRQSDTIGRWGGEEFLILCPETEAKDALLLGEKLRKMLQSAQMLLMHTQTASFGVCTYNGSDDLETFIIRADEALYQSKAEGRNRVTLYEYPLPVANP